MCAGKKTIKCTRTYGCTNREEQEEEEEDKCTNSDGGSRVLHGSNPIVMIKKIRFNVTRTHARTHACTRSLITGYVREKICIVMSHSDEL